MEEMNHRNELEIKPYKDGTCDFKFEEIRDLKGRIGGMREYMNVLAHQYRNTDKPNSDDEED